MGPNGQNQHFAELRQKVFSSIQDLVLQRDLPILDGKLERFVTKKMKVESDRLCNIATEIFVRSDLDRTAMISHINVQHTNLNPS